MRETRNQWEGSSANVLLLIVALVVGILIGWSIFSRLWRLGAADGGASVKSEVERLRAELSAKSSALEAAERRGTESGQRSVRVDQLERELETASRAASERSEKIAELTRRAQASEEAQQRADARNAQLSEEVQALQSSSGSSTDAHGAAGATKDARIAELEASRRKQAAHAAVTAPGMKIAGVAAPVAGVRDDLKEIKGVGPVLEGVLHDYGIVTFKQLADLDEASVQLVEDQLTEFPGRIRRDSWVSQAADLQRKHHEA